MKKISFAIVGAAALALAACGGKGDDALGDNVADNYEAAADNLEMMAVLTVRPLVTRQSQEPDYRWHLCERAFAVVSYRSATWSLLHPSILFRPHQQWRFPARKHIRRWWWRRRGTAPRVRNAYSAKYSTDIAASACTLPAQPR